VLFSWRDVRFSRKEARLWTFAETFRGMRGPRESLFKILSRRRHRHMRSGNSHFSGEISRLASVRSLPHLSNPSRELGDAAQKQTWPY
jgi:hypothetical protein